MVLISNKTTGNLWSTSESSQSILVNNAGDYTATYTGENGCTSPASAPATVTVGSATISTTNLTICSDQLPYAWNNDIFAEAGTYGVTLTNATGCDSMAF
ncbi:MAG: hypothetical protein WDO16_13525 [Bacteroidota bacterium]